MAQESKLSSSGNGSKDSDANLMNGAVHRLVVESMEDARATAADDGERIEVFEEVAPVESGILRSTFRPVQRGTLVIAGITLLGAMGAARLIAHGGQRTVEAANKAGSMAANSLHASTDREQVLDFLSQAEGEGRWLVEGLAGLAGYGRINP